MLYQRAPLNNCRWPFGKDGDLIITSGNTVTIQAGSIKDYRSIRVDAGSTLVIDGTSSTLPTIIGCRTTCVINGTIKSNSGYIAGTFSTTDPFGQTLSYTTVQKLGGDGGGAGTGVGATPTSGKGGTDGSGGGGRGGDGGGLAGPGGAGGYNGSGGRTGTLNGSGGGVLMDNGNKTFGDGATRTYGSVTGADGGGSGGGSGGRNNRGYSEDHDANGGGGGGYRGAHGGCLFLYCNYSITGVGLIDCGGKVGFKGGNGGFDGGHGNYLSYQAGHSGGGGAGGSGGKLKVRYRGSFTVPYSVAGGAGGLGGVANYGDTTTLPGLPGENGNNGTTDIVNLLQ